MALQVDKYHVTLRLTEDILGTVPKNRKVFSSYIQDKQRKEIEKAHKKGVPLTNGEAATEAAITALLEPEPETIQEAEERGWTGQ